MKISVENISKTIGTQKVLDSISFRIKEAEIVGVLGANGAGKTSILKILSGYMQPDSGEVYYDSLTVKRDALEIKKKIGYLPENNPLYEEMNVVDFLQFIAEIYQIPNFYAKIRIADVLQMCGLEDVKHKNIRSLSKGHKQRIGLAQAIIHSPEVILLDEPTTGLDPFQISEIRDMVKNLGKDRQRTVIISSHLLSEVEELCNRVLIVDKGRIIADGNASELQKCQYNIYKLQIANGEKEDVMEKMAELDGVEFVDEQDGVVELHVEKEVDIEKNIFEVCVEQDWYIRTLFQEKAHLSELFKSITSLNEEKCK